MARHHLYTSPDYDTTHIYNTPCLNDNDCDGVHVHVHTVDELHDLICAALDDHDCRPDDEHSFDLFDVAAWFDDYQRAAVQFHHDTNA